MDLKLKNNALLKLDYFPVEYIQTSGAVNIDTGVSITNDTNFEIDADLEVTSNGGDKSEIYGTIYNTGTWYMGLFAVSSSITSFNAATFTTSNKRSSYLSLTLEGRLKIKHNKSYINVNGTEYSFSGDQGSGTDKNLYILGSSSGYSTATAKIYSFKIYVNNILVRDYMPCISISNGNPALYDKVNGTLKYPASGGTFTAYPSTSLSDYFTTMYVKDCPNISGINLLRKARNLTHVRCDIGTVSGTLAEIQYYATLHGFDANEKPDNTVPATINGTFTITDWYTTADLQALQNVITGLTVLGDGTHNIDAALENEDLAVQTLDSTRPGYNPAVAIILNNNGKGNLIGNSIISGEGRYFIAKSEVAAITSISNIFMGITSIVDSNGIVTNDNTESYDFTEFNEFKYFTGLTSIPNGTNSSGAFYNCSALTSVEIPEGVTSIGMNNFRGVSSLNRVVLPSTLTYVAGYNFGVYNQPIAGSNVYYNGSMEDWLTKVSFLDAASTPLGAGSHFYINNEEVTNITIPDGITNIRMSAFSRMSYITSVDLNNVTSITGSNTSSSRQFYECTSLVNLDLSHFTSEVSISHCIGGAGSTAAGNKVILGGSAVYIRSGAYPRFPIIIIHGNIRCNNSTDPFLNTTNVQQCRVKGNVSNNLYFKIHNPCFIEICGTINTTAAVCGNNSNSGMVFHLGNTNLATDNAAYFCENISTNLNKITKVYVGDGSSKASDENTLALYLANSTWNVSAYSNKLATWWDYNGEYKWYRVNETLTNVSNSNSIDWPYITRGESYSTILTADEGYTIDSVVVTMYEATDNGTTPTDPTVITNDVYNQSTGEINIASVTGNISITASATANS